MTMDATLASHLQELRRGTVVVASLIVLGTPGYGYSLLETLGAAGFDVEANTLYPLLRRLEAQGLLTSEWNTDEPRPRKFYRTTGQGAAIAAALRAEWSRLDEAIAGLDLPPADHPPATGADRPGAPPSADDTPSSSTATTAGSAR